MRSASAAARSLAIRLRNLHAPVPGSPLVDFVARHWMRPAVAVNCQTRRNDAALRKPSLHSCGSPFDNFVLRCGDLTSVRPAVELESRLVEACTFAGFDENVTTRGCIGSNARSQSVVPGWSSKTLRALADRYSWEAMQRESPPRVKELAASLRISSAECTSLFRHVVGDSPSNYLRRVQLDRAKYLLLQTTLSMNEIAYQSGFGTRTTFFRAFKRQTGLTPKEYRLGNG